MLLERLLANDPRLLTTLSELWRALAEDRDASSFDRAVLAGRRSDRVGIAFAAGYTCALNALAPAVVPVGRRASLCASEDRGAHPRYIETKLVGGVLHGHKRWATLAPEADVLLVVASTGTDSTGKKRLKVVAVDPRAPGVQISPRAEVPIAPEIPHGDLVLADVRVAEADLLEGDGYEAYVKPFRTIEDLHVVGALAGYLIGEARRRSWPHDFAELALALVLGLRAASAMDPKVPALHVALGGLFVASERVLASADALFASAGGEAAERWRRDRGLLSIAGNARAKRLEAAWRDVEGLQPPRGVA